MNVKMVVAIGVSIVGVGVSAETYTWVGPENASWNDKANWRDSTGATGVAYPWTGDKAVIQGGVVSLPNSVQVGKLALSGTVTVNGPGCLDVAGDPLTDGAYVTAAGGTYTFNGPFIFSNTKSSANQLPSGGTTYFNGSFQSSLERLTLGGGGTIHLACTAGTYPATVGLLMVENAVLHIDTPNNYFKRIEVHNGGKIEINVDQPWNTDLMRQYGSYSHLYGTGTLNLHGHDVEFSPLLILGAGTDETTVTTDANSPAVLSARDTVSTGSAVVRTNSTCNMTGPVTYRLAAGSKGTVALNRLLDLSGGVEVMGGILDFTANAEIPNASHLSIGSDAKVRLAEGLCLVVPALYLDGATASVAEGTYGASGSGADFTDDVHFTGKGRVLVLDAAAAGVERTLVADGDWTEKTNWDPEGYPHPKDKIVVRDHALNLNQRLAVDSIKLGGTVASVTGKRLTLLNASASKAYSSSSSGTYTFDAELVFRYPKTELVEMYGTTYFRGGLTFNDGVNYFYPSYGTVHFQNKPVNIYRCVPNKAATLYLDSANNRLGRVEASGGVTYHITSDNPWVDDAFDYMDVINGGTVHLHGHDIHVANWLVLGSNATTGSGLLDTEEGSPATISVRSTQTASNYVRTNSIIDIVGPLTLKFESGSVTRMIFDRAISSTGSLIVEGSVFEMTRNGTWANATNIVAKGTGKIIINNEKSFNRRSTVRLGSMSNLEIASPVVQRVRELYVNDEAQPAGLYDFGTGKLRVTGCGLKIVVR